MAKQITYYGYAVNGKPTLFPHEGPINPPVGRKYTVVKAKGKWFALYANGDKTMLTDSPKSYKVHLTDGAWIPFKGNPFKVPNRNKGA
jgi:hypothetical protein